MRKEEEMTKRRRNEKRNGMNEVSIGRGSE